MIHYMALAFFGVWLVCFLADKKPGWFKRKKLLLIAAVANIGSFVARKLLFAVIMQTKYSFYADYFLQDISIWGYLPGILICFFAVWMIKYVDKQDTRKYFVIVSLWVNLSLMYIIIGMLAWRWISGLEISYIRKPSSGQWREWGILSRCAIMRRSIC